MQESTERRLLKQNKSEEANAVFTKLVENGALVEISPQEQSTWSGPTHYLPIQAVIKEESVTTPLRLVTNSSLTDHKTGISLNSILYKGPLQLNDLYELFIRFRSYPYGLTGDISKAYHQILTGPLEKHTRRVLWRYSQDEPWKIYGFQVLSMGDAPAATIMELTRNLTIHG